ncbi:hypothetical protein LCGC14_2346480 [marine sediment metagenome]|uniref:Uncharacterized protein n=1 Tax=marine sediment metagenome TaxID=412755 RepID=A0A0F9CBC5_9ZZZZ
MGPWLKTYALVIGTVFGLMGAFIGAIISVDENHEVGIVVIWSSVGFAGLMYLVFGFANC